MLWVLGGMSSCWLVLGIVLIFPPKPAGWSFSNHVTILLQDFHQHDQHYNVTSNVLFANFCKKM